MKATLKFDFDWKDYDSMFASAVVELKGEGDPFQALKDLDDEVVEETSSNAISFVPETVNGQRLETDEEFNDFFWTTSACLTFLKQNPNARLFKLEGRME